MRFLVLGPLLSSALLLAACGLQDAQVVALDGTAGKIDLGTQLGGDWDRVCILMPYATAAQAERLLGFPYAPEVHSAIAVTDDRTLLVTVSGNEVVGAFEVLRRTADFTQVGAGCYARSKAVFDYEAMDGGRHRISAT